MSGKDQLKMKKKVYKIVHNRKEGYVREENRLLDLLCTPRTDRYRLASQHVIFEVGSSVVIPRSVT